MKKIIEKLIFEWNRYVVSISNKIILTYISLLFVIWANGKIIIGNIVLREKLANMLKWDLTSIELLIACMFLFGLLLCLNLIFMYLDQRSKWLDYFGLLQILSIGFLFITKDISFLINVLTGSIAVITIVIIVYLLIFIPRLVRQKKFI